MKRMKQRIIALIITVAMICTTGITALADTTGSITVKNTNTAVSIDGKTFNAYKIFDVTYSGDAYSYTVATGFEDFFTANPSYTVEYLSSQTNNSAVMNAFAKAIHTYIDAGSGVSPTATTTADGEEAEFTGLELGYYIVRGEANVNGTDDDTVTSLCMLNTTNPDMEVTIKVDVPTFEKSVQEDRDESWNSVADYTIGDTVPFKLTSKVPNTNGYTDYIFEFGDTLDTGLTLDITSIKLTIAGAEINGSDYTLVTGTNQFKLTIPQDLLEANSVGDSIVITYEATLSDEALIYNSSNDNNAYLKYSNDPYTENSFNTIEDKAKVYTYELNIFKYTGNLDESPTPLPGAEFELTEVTGTGSNEAESAPIRFIYDADSGVYRVTTQAAGETGVTTKLVSGTDGTIKIEGLDQGKYKLTETLPPDGYNQLDAPVVVEIDSTFNSDADDVSSVTYKSNGTSTSVINVLNETGTKLPSTGGIGTTIFYAVGLILMVGAAGYFVVSRRRKHN